MPGGDPNPPGGPNQRLSNSPTSFIDTAIHNIQLALDDVRTPEASRPDLLHALAHLESAAQ